MISALSTLLLRLGNFAFAVCAVLIGTSSFGAQDAGQADFFEREIRPLLVKRCYTCHSSQVDEPKGDLVLDSRRGVLEGGLSGPAVVVGKPDQSLLVTAIRYEDDHLQMPPSARLQPDEIEKLEHWVSQGAFFPEGLDLGRPPAPDSEAARDFWSFRPPASSSPPHVTDAEWSKTRTDQFLLAKMEARGLTPSEVADRRTLIRRATFDVTGLPPTAAQVDSFCRDDSDDAYERLVDRLLASPAYGERWSRWWLDLARYTDTTAAWLESTGDAWRYRDWVVGALQQDLSYDRFVKLQLAADTLDDASVEDLAALGFIGLSPTYWKELRLAPSVIRVVVAEEWDERIDTVTRTFLGLTVACARCHDHKFDPITVEDYYALAGVFANTRLVDRPLLPDADAEVVRLDQKRIDALQANLDKLKQSDPEQARKLSEQINQIRRSNPHLAAPRVHAVEDARIRVVPDGSDRTRVEYEDELSDVSVFVRGNPENHGPVVARRFIRVLAADSNQSYNHGSGRHELAESLVRDGLPLSARVIVNRIWAEHFGRGLVATLSNLGAQGDPPSHPRLLDDLTVRFVENGWSLKWLHREILLSSAYRQKSHPTASGQRIDPENVLLWRMNRRRLSIESWRDSMLAVTGRLDLQLGGAPMNLQDPRHRRRTLYGEIHRRDLNGMLSLYDFPEPTSHSPMRTPTTTPLQQLFALNSEFVEQQAKGLASRILNLTPDTSERVRACYCLMFQREPSASEVRFAVDFLEDSTDGAEAWTRYAHVLLTLNEFMFVD